MVLVDTSVWASHFRSGDRFLPELLMRGEVLVHPFVIGELACGNLKNRANVLGDLGTLPKIGVAEDEEVLRMIEDRRLWGSGIGWIDCHLLASSLIAACRFWTLDKRLDRIAQKLGIAAWRS